VSKVEITNTGIPAAASGAVMPATTPDSENGIGPYTR
jgi:hypothetical protein